MCVTDAEKIITGISKQFNAPLICMDYWAYYVASRL